MSILGPLSALGLASNIIQLIDFGYTIISHSLEYYKSTRGTLTANEELDIIIKNLNEICERLGQPERQIDGASASKSENALIPLSQSCRHLAKRFLAVLDGLRVKGNHKRWDSARQALKTAWKRKEIQDFEKRLDGFRSEITFNLIAMLSGKTSEICKGQVQQLKEASNVSKKLDQLAEKHQRLEVPSANSSQNLRQEILLSIKEIREDSSLGKSLDDIRRQLLTLASGGTILERQLSIIESLQFPTISTRHERIGEAHRATLDWLFEYEPSSPASFGVSMQDWLLNRNGVYWVSGKAGSGKSTLMKFLSSHKNTLEALRIWAGEKQLVTASFFFWNAGTDMQKSQQGLLQTLLYHVLRQCTELIPTLCPSRWHEGTQNSWTRLELLSTFGMLQGQATKSSRFCFFIDGLDEFEGDHTELLDIIDNFANAKDVKVFFSSRPWNVFENAYEDNHGLRLRLQDLTREDIRIFVNDMLSEDLRFRQLQAVDVRYNDLIEEIVGRANGVFLWVFLVVRSLRRGLTNFDTILEFQERLRILPTELEDYFKLMLDSVEKVYHKQAARIYLMCVATPGSMTTMTASYFDEEDKDFALASKFESWDPERVDQICKTTERRVMARCTDLLEVTPDSKIEPLHRTVYDFLEARDIQKLTIARAGADFDAHNHLCNAMICQVKMFPKHAFSHERLRPLLDGCIYHAHQMELQNNSAYIRLIDEMDWAISLFPNNTLFTTKWRSHYLGSELPHPATVELEDVWVISVAIQRGLYVYLSSRSSRVRSRIMKQGNRERPPLDIALRPKVLPVLETAHKTEADPRIVSLLLAQGADPNEIFESPVGQESEVSSVWNLFLKAQPRTLRPLAPPDRIALFQIIEMLLVHGADPEASDLNEVISKNFTSGEAARLNDIKPVQQEASVPVPVSNRGFRLPAWLTFRR